MKETKRAKRKEKGKESEEKIEREGEIEGASWGWRREREITGEKKRK